VSPEAPAGVQNAPAVTSLTIKSVAVDEGVGVAGSDDGIAEGAGDEDSSVEGVGDVKRLVTTTPLFQTNLPLDLMQVNFMPFEVFTEFIGLHAVPDLIAPNALEGKTRLAEIKNTNKTFFIPVFPH
jgi:hypothetical protein